MLSIKSMKGKSKNISHGNENSWINVDINGLSLIMLILSIFCVTKNIVVTQEK